MHTIISALANVSNGGATDILVANLNFKSVVGNHSFNTIFKRNFPFNMRLIKVVSGFIGVPAEKEFQAPMSTSS